jgi:hypothetical protein
MILALIEAIPAYIAKCNEALSVENQRFGGYLCVYGSAQSPDQPPIMILRIGEIIEEKLTRCFDLCQEKARRLLAHPEHLSSWQSRVERQNQYGGAIRIRGCVLAFSGHIEKADEAILVNAACALGMLNHSTAGAIASFSKNELITA